MKKYQLQTTHTMLEYDRIDTLEGYLCNGFHNLMQKSYEF